MPARKKTKAKPGQSAAMPAGMTPEEFEAAASEALGGRGWQKAFSRGTGLAPSTITRYLQGIYEVPQYVAVIVEMLATLRRNGLPMPEAFSAEHLPGEPPSNDEDVG